jgi:hypothetical protein
VNGRGIELRRPRDITALFRDAIEVYGRSFATFAVVAAAIVFPANMIVSGVGLEQLTAPYDGSTSAAEAVIPSLVSFLVVAPLVTATCIYALVTAAEGGSPKPGRALAAGLDAFAPIFFAVVLAALGIALGLVALILPGVYLAVRWYFVPQAVVLDRARGPGALGRSGEAVQGFWWRAAGIVLAANLAATVPGLALLIPFDAIARSADREVWALLGAALTETITTPFVALVSTLLWFDLLERRRSR